MIEGQWNIYWNEYSSDTYLYGSEVIFHSRDDVEFRNTLMPPGTVIKTWYSMTNFQAQHIEPALPIIDGESSYRIKVNMDIPEHQHCLVRLVFYDRYGNEAGYLNIRNVVTDFQCPLKTYSYTMQLINGGVTEFHFHSIVIQEKEVAASDRENKKTE